MDVTWTNDGAGRERRPTAWRLLHTVWLLAACSVLALGGQSGPDEADERPELEMRDGGVTLVRIDQALDDGTLALVHRAIRHAAANGDHLVIELDTPGGGLRLMWRISKAITGANEEGVTTIAWVNDRALSAGALLGMACDRLYMREQASIGSAQPIRIGITGVEPASADERIEEKLDSTTRSAFRGVAERRGRPPILAEAMVDMDVEVLLVELDGERLVVSGTQFQDMKERGDRVELVRTVVTDQELFNATGREAVQLQVADGIADTLDELLAKIGKAGVEPTVLERTPSEDLAGVLYSFAPLLLVLGILFAFVEFKVPGFGIPGVASIACFAVFLFGRYLVGLADIPQIVLVGIGVIAVAVDLFLLPGTVWVGLVGAFCVVTGLGWAFVGDFSFQHGVDRQLLLDGAVSFALSGVVALLLMWGLSRVLPRTPLFARFTLDPGVSTGPGEAMLEARGAHARAARVGASGRALTALRPVGKVALDEDDALEYEARSSGVEIDAGRRVRVVEVQGSGRLVVEADAEA